MRLPTSIAPMIPIRAAHQSVSNTGEWVRRMGLQARCRHHRPCPRRCRYSSGRDRSGSILGFCPGMVVAAS